MACVIKGRNPYSYFESAPDIKFNSKQFRDIIGGKPELRDALLRDCAPSLYRLLSTNQFDPEKEFSPQEIINRFNEAYQENDVDFDTEVNRDE